MAISLICPTCRRKLDESAGDRLSCDGCGRTYPKEDGVVRLLERADEFYEGAYQNRVRYVPKSEKPWHVWPLWLIQNGYPWTVRHFVPAGSTVVELGCAGGLRYLGRRYSMIGCDVSFGSLKNLEGYEMRVQSDASTCIPLPDASVDAVISSFFWEHIPPNVKPAILQECQRVLRPNGKLIFLYDVETNNPLIRPYKENNRPLYDKLFIEGDGHLGYERPGDNLAAFRSAGFTVLDHRGLEKTFLQSAPAYTKLAEFDGPAQSLFQVAKRLGNAPWFYPYTALLRVVDEMVCPLLNDDWARIDLVVCGK